MASLKLREQQLDALNSLLTPGRKFGALWASPRSGKTAVALRWIEGLGARLALVVGPKIAEITWRAEAAKWLTVPHMFYPLTRGNEYPTVTELRDSNHLVILFVNYEQFGSAPFVRLKRFLSKLYSLPGKHCCILDESHYIKTPNAVIGKNIRPLAKDWEYRLIITGTPVVNPTQVDAIYGQWVFLDPHIRDRWPRAYDFRNYFGEWSTVKGYPELIRATNQVELYEYLSPHVVTMTGPKSSIKYKQFMYDLPTDVHLYNGLIRDSVIRYNGHTVAALNPLTKLIRLRQIIAGWCVDDTGKAFIIKEFLSSRLKALRHIIESTSGKIIISCAHLLEIRLVSAYLRKLGYSSLIINGNTKDKELILNKFSRQKQYRILIVHPRTVCMAVDISAASHLVWYTSDYNYVTFKQMSDRIKLSLIDPTVWFLAARDSIDEDIWLTLRKDHNHLKYTLHNIESLSIQQ